MTIAFDISYNGSKKLMEYGTMCMHQGDLYEYVYNASTDTDAVKGQFACTYGATPAKGHVTMKAADVADGTLGTVTKARGVWAAAVSGGNSGFILRRGYCDYLVTDGGVAKGDPLVCDGGATPTFIADTAAAGEEHAVVAHADADDVASVGTAYIDC